MAISYPEILKGIIAAEGDWTDIPLASQSGGLASFTDGFPPITEQPIAAGGLPPQRKDFNGFFNLLSQHIYWGQSGGQYVWSSALDYNLPAMVVGSDGKLYRALLASGPGTAAGAKDPTSQPTYWQDYAASITPSGPTVDELFLGGGVLTESETGGATSVKNLLATNGLSVVGMSFQGSTADTSAEFDVRLPSNWDHGTVKAKLHWSPAAGASAGDLVRWSLAAVAAGDDDAMDAALGSSVTIDDTVLAVGDMHITSASAALTIAGTPQAGDMLHFKLTRSYAYGSPHLDEAAVVWGITIQYGLTGNIAAW